MTAMQKPEAFNAERVEDTLVAYFSGQHWAEFVRGLDSGPHIRHAHAYYNSVLEPKSVAYFLTRYFHRFGKPLQRKIKILPVTEDFLNVYNVHAEGQCHWEFFLHYKTGTLLEPDEAYGARAAHSMEFWDDASMDAYYRQFSFRDIGSVERADVDAYLRGQGWNDNIYTLLDDFGGVIHTHALCETCLHPEQLKPLIEEHWVKRGWQLSKSVSVVFNSYGMDIGKLVFLLKKPEIVVELEWHFNPEVTLRPATTPFFRIATAASLSGIMRSKPFVSFGPETTERVIDRLRYPA